MAQKNVYPGDYIIPFSDEVAHKIMEGKKNKTYRYGDKYSYLEEGDVVKLIKYTSKKHLADAKIIEKYTTTFGKLGPNNEGHEKYGSKEDMRKTFNDYYSYLGRDIKDEDKFLVLKFDLL